MDAQFAAVLQAELDDTDQHVYYEFYSPHSSHRIHRIITLFNACRARVGQDIATPFNINTLLAFLKLYLRQMQPKNGNTVPSMDSIKSIYTTLCTYGSNTWQNWELPSHARTRVTTWFTELVATGAVIKGIGRELSPLGAHQKNGNDVQSLDAIKSQAKKAHGRVD